MKRKIVFTMISLVALAIGGNVMHNIEANQIEAATQAAQAEKLRLAQEKRDALAAEFQANRPTLISEAQRLIAQGSPAAAQTLLAKFVSLKDTDVTQLLALATRNAHMAQSIKQLSDELASKPTVERSMAIYKELKFLEPSNPLWPAMIQEIQPTFVAKASHKAELEKTAARKEAVRRLFSGWDGSVRSVEQAIKLRLKDPDSYKHVETKFNDPGFGDVTIFTQYRARNSFNALITDVATAVVSPTGELVSISLKN